MKSCYDYILQRKSRGEEIPTIPRSMGISGNRKWAGKYQYGSDKHLPMHRHEGYCDLFLTLSDDVVHVYGGKTEILPKNTLVLVRPEDAHRHYSLGKENKPKWLNFVVAIDIVEQALTYLSNAGLDKDVVMKSHTLISRQLSELEAGELVMDYEKQCVDRTKNERKLFHVYVWLINVFGKYLFCPEADSARVLPPVWLERTYDEMKLYDNFVGGLPQMVKLSGKTKEHLARSMKKYYGITPGRYINDLRLSYAANRLKCEEADSTTLDIIYECGFQSVGYFYKLFSKKYGISPSAYRKQKEAHK